MKAITMATSPNVLSSGEEAFPRIGETLTAIGSEIEGIGGLAEKATRDLLHADKQGKGFPGRLTVARKLAQDLSGPADRILEMTNSYTASLYDADNAIRTIIARAPGEVKDRSGSD